MYINITGKKLHLFQFIGKKNVVIDMHVVLSLYFVKIIFLHIKMNDMYVCVLFHTTVMYLKSCGGFERRDAKQGSGSVRVMRTDLLICNSRTV